MKVNTIYAAFNGEQNQYGIGSLTLFLRLQGCHLRCYLKTMGMLCDTPEGLEREGGRDMTVPEVIAALNELRQETGIGLVCLTGGDPLWRRPEELHELLQALYKARYKVTIETSGTLSWEPYVVYGHVALVLDYKLQSAGIKEGQNLVRREELVGLLRHRDVVKFVVADDADYLELREVLPVLFYQTSARLTAGPMWEGKLTAFQLFDRLRADNLLRFLRGGVNFQTHKLVEHAALNPPQAGQKLSTNR